MANEKRLIDANKLKDRFKLRINWLEKDVHDQYSLGLFHGAEYDAKLIDEIPTVDAVEVVRCYFCKHYNRIMGTCMVDRKLGQTTPQIRVKQDDFCSYGERKDNERKAD